MKLTVQKDRFNEAVQHASKAISSRTAIPILSGIKIEADAEGLVLTASDTDISIQCFIPAEEDGMRLVHLEREGSVVLPARFLSELIKKLPSPQVELEMGDSFLTTIRSGSSEVQIMGLDPEDYPQLPELEENRRFTLPSDLLKSMIKQTVFAVSTNESTPILTGILWNVNDQRIKFTACDRHRLASRTTSLDVDADFQLPAVVIAGRTMGELNKILPDDNALIDIVIADNQVLFRLPSLLFYTRILEGTYPDTSRLIPTSFQTEIVMDTKNLIDAIDRANLLSREEKTNIVRLWMKEDGTIEISSSSSELGKMTEQLNAHSITGELLRISFNSKYMLDALRAIDSDRIHIGFSGATAPIIIQPEDRTGVLQLILPYRTTN